MHRKDVELYEELNSKLISLKGDIALLSAKKPNETVNEFKLKLINKMLAQINDLIKEFKPENDFEAFDLDVLPTNSDVLMMLNLYSNGMRRFKDANSIENSKMDEWNTKFTSKVWDIEDYLYII